MIPWEVASILMLVLGFGIGYRTCHRVLWDIALEQIHTPQEGRLVERIFGQPLSKDLRTRLVLEEEDRQRQNIEDMGR